MDPSHTPRTRPPKKRKSKPSSATSTFPPSQPPEDGADRLTDLPEPLRHHILSLLPLSAAIRTGALSSQWKNLWKTRRHPNRTPASLSLNVTSNGPLDTLFHFLCLVLSDPKKLCHSLRLSLLPEVGDLPALRNVLRNAATCGGVEDLFLNLRSTSPTFRRPLITFDLSDNFSSLGKLSLSGFRLSSPPSYFNNFPNLEHLSFHGINITDTAFRMVVANCRQLRHLDVRRCPDLKKVVIAGRKMANVTVMECPRVTHIVVRSKILRKFHFKGGGFAREYKFKGVDRVEDVYMCSDDDGGSQMTTNWVTVVDGFRHVKVLTLCSLSLKCMLAADANVLRQFNTLGCLQELQLLMLSQTDQDLEDTYKFFALCRCPVLEKIFIQLSADMPALYMGSYFEEKTEEPLTTDLSTVKTVRINGFKGCRNEIRLVRFFLSNAQSLKDLIIVAPPQEEHDGSYTCKEALGMHSQFLESSQARFTEIMVKSSMDARIVFSERDDSGVRPRHEGCSKHGVLQGEWFHC